jgi:hypothetical protein
MCFTVGDEILTGFIRHGHAYKPPMKKRPMRTKVRRRRSRRS